MTTRSTGARPTAGTGAVVETFNRAVDQQDLAAVLALLTHDAVFETTGPAPDGTRFTGRRQVGEAFAALFASARERRFETEEQLVAGDRAVVRWRHHWTAHDGSTGHVRGVDVFRVRDGHVAEKLSYVKG